jgi:hypothetical protein
VQNFVRKKLMPLNIETHQLQHGPILIFWSPYFPSQTDSYCRLQEEGQGGGENRPSHCRTSGPGGHSEAAQVSPRRNAAAGRQLAADPPGSQQGSILQNSVSAENFYDQFLSSNCVRLSP